MLIECWDNPPSLEEHSIAPILPAKWQDVVAVIPDRNFIILQPDHPIMRLVPENECSQKFREWAYASDAEWSPLNVKFTPQGIAENLLELSVRALRSNLSSEWDQFRKHNPDSVKRWWEILSNATSRTLRGLAIVVAKADATVLLTQEGLTRWTSKSKFPNPLPEVTDPEFLLVEAEV